MKHHVIWVLTYDIEYNNVLVGANTFNHHYFTVYEGTLTGLYHGLALRMEHELGCTCTDSGNKMLSMSFMTTAIYCHYILPPYITTTNLINCSYTQNMQFQNSYRMVL